MPTRRMHEIWLAILLAGYTREWIAVREQVYEQAIYDREFWDLVHANA